MAYLKVILLAYLIGSSSMSFYLSKLNHVDLTKKGSKNLGASNTMILMGWKAGILVALHDILKAVLAIYLASQIAGDLPYIRAIAGVACVYGHIFPFYLKFKGGKGFASFIGMTLALNWKFALALIVIIIIVTLITDYIVSGTLTSITITPIFFGIYNHNIYLALIILLASLVILYKHRENIPRIINGTEIGLRKAHRGDYRK